MQKQFTLFITSFALLSGALLSACDSKKKEVALPVHSPAITEAPKAVEMLISAQASKQPLQNYELQLQPTSAATPDLATLAIGEKVYKSTCGICHKSGLNGAPRMGSRKDWEPRLAQDNEVLYGHAVNGFRGSKGSMPSRGSNARLSETEVKAAVDYIVVHSIPSWSVE